MVKTNIGYLSKKMKETITQGLGQKQHVTVGSILFLFDVLKES